MGGGLMQLVAYGARDITGSSAPQIEYVRDGSKQSEICVRYGLSVSNSVDITNIVKLIIDSGIITSLPAGDVERLNLLKKFDNNFVDPYPNKLKSIFIGSEQFHSGVTVDLSTYEKSILDDEQTVFANDSTSTRFLGTSTELNYDIIKSNHSTVVIEKIYPKVFTNIQLFPNASSTYPIETIIPSYVLNFAKSRLNFQLALPAGTNYNYVNGNALTLISRVVLKDTFTNICLLDCSKFEKYASLAGPISTSFKEFITKAAPNSVEQTSTASSLACFEDMGKCNSLYNITGNGTDIGLPYLGRTQFLVGGDKVASFIDYSIPFSAFNQTILCLDKNIYSPNPMCLQVYFNQTDNFGFNSTNNNDPVTGVKSLATGVLINNFSVQLAKEGNQQIISKVIDKVMSEGISVPFAYPTIISRELPAALTHSYTINLTKVLGDRITYIFTAPFSAETGCNNTNVHCRGALASYNTFWNSKPIKSQSNINCLTSEDYSTNRYYLKGCCVQTIHEYTAAEWVHVDSFIGDIPICRFDQTIIDGLDVSTKDAAWSISANLSNPKAYNWVSLIVGQKTAIFTRSGIQFDYLKNNPNNKYNIQKKLNNQRPLGVYYQSWSESATPLAQIPSPINLVYLSFANPSCTYTTGSNSWSGTGLNFSSDFSVIKGAIQILHQRNVIVMISVGGATYPYTDTFSPSNVAALVNDLGADGVDIDWEPSGGMSASSQLGPIIQQMRSALPKGFISLAGFSVGAYGQGNFVNATPASANTGMCIKGLQSNGKQLDWVNIMSYDASNAYNPLVAFQAYRSYFSGPLMIGTEVPPEAWGGHILTLTEVQSYATTVISDPQLNGLFVWSYQKSGTPSCIDIITAANGIFKNSPTFGYGISSTNYTDITAALTKLAQANPNFIIPAGDGNRAAIFGDPYQGKLKVIIKFTSNGYEIFNDTVQVDLKK